MLGGASRGIKMLRSREVRLIQSISQVIIKEIELLQVITDEAGSFILVLNNMYYIERQLLRRCPNAGMEKFPC